MKKRRYSRNNDSLVLTAVRSEWQFSAFLSVGFFAVAFIILPFFGSKSGLIQTLLGIVRLFLILPGGLFALIALFNYFRKTKPDSYNALPQSNVISLRKRQGSQESQDPEHQVVHGWSKTATQWGNLGVPSNPNAMQRPSAWSMELLQQIEWKLFEDISAAYYKEKGIRAELTKLGADGGIDIKLFQDDSGKPTSLVQCKAWNTKLVGVKPIREFLGVMSHEKIPKGFFMASGAYSPDAIEIAKANGITLVDGKMFLAMIQRLPADAQQRLLDLATAGEYTTPSCPSCGVKMLRRSGKRGDFWGCLNFLRCRQMMHVKSVQTV